MGGGGDKISKASRQEAEANLLSMQCVKSTLRSSWQSLGAVVSNINMSRLLAKIKKSSCCSRRKMRPLQVASLHAHRKLNARREAFLGEQGSC